MDKADTFFDIARQVYHLSKDVYGEKYSLGHFLEDITRMYPDFATTDFRSMTSEGCLEAVYALVEELKVFNGN